ncbi:MAG: GHKL domain-containing protein [Fibromonadaceae bacterium]|jgi:signal transduction histidine kinase|nr:GHKL domain-containing protein [Fibromonadaceae bacterium]
MQKSQDELISELATVMERFLAQGSELEFAYKALEMQTEQLKKMQEEVNQSRVLSALGEMAATVAHEIRNPLGGIGGYASLLARSIPPEDPKRKYVDKIIGGISSLNKIVGNLLAYTRKTNLQKQNTDLVNWAEAILAHAEIEIEKEKKQLFIERNFPTEPLNAEIDAERLQQVMLNLLMNAIQAIETDGKISVGISSNEKFAEITVADTGNGIEPEHLKNIFTPFFTTKEQGTGLGLAIVKKIIDLHEGEITVESSVGKGTSFRIKIPFQSNSASPLTSGIGYSSH